MACSAAERMLEVGAFTTMTPRAVAAGHVDVVEADAGPADHHEVGPGGQDLGGHLGGRADDEGVGPGDRARAAPRG